MISNKRYISVHEACHTVMALLNNCYVPEVVVTQRCGLTIYYQFLNLKTSRNKECQIYYAGFLGERYLHHQFYNTKFPSNLKEGSKKDFYRIYYLSKHYKLKLSSVKNTANKKIAKYWVDIEKVAKVLFYENSIDFIGLKKILLAGPNKAYWKNKFKTIENKYKITS